ncbi:Acetyltransferase (GNAT) family protein [Enterovibrio nigricans DSM 22720]|uniref:Acetyltransferase (GNAT) family protein n=1 Tax=Enterovibrio nigricans DSM 22720 TaxID=1121868 RepID=A0A1T4UQG1_9GAMM|nr:Acetyltransferase (GNAT) family protein [Enterovibrio nigricans DSM 22720]
MLGIGISQKYQGQGLGGKLIEILIENARSNNCRAIELTTVLNNNRAFALYQKLGFLYLGKVNNLVGDGSVVEESHMYFPIEPGVKIPQRNHVTPFL